MSDAVMNSENARDLIVDAIEFVAPDIDARAIRATVDMRVEADLDSIDFISVLTTIRDRTGIEVQETDYARCHTIDGFADYLVERSGELRNAVVAPPD